MKKRTFLKSSSLVVAGTALGTIVSCKPAEKKSVETAAAEGPFSLPQLAFAFDALAPNIDETTMQIHHGKHHAGYVRKLNAALENNSLAGKTIEEILNGVGPEDAAVRNNGGGHYNHTLFWSILSPGGVQPSGDILDAINGSFGSFDNFKSLFSTAAKTQFGSGWAWLCKGDDGKLFVSKTANQDNPLMNNIVGETGTPILGLDVWEHAYYLNYQNRRGDYVDNFFNIINWDVVNSNLG